MLTKQIAGEMWTEDNLRHNNRAASIELDNMVSALYESKEEAIMLGLDWCPTDGLDPDDCWVSTPDRKALYKAVMEIAMALGHLSGDFGTTKNP